MSFLNAEWRKLALANYEVDPVILEKYIPPKTELDLWNGACYVSLVGFMFLKTKLLGLPIPFHRTFEEVNLRFYVKHFDGEKWKRGVVFIKEIVPKPALTFVANTIYKEHYETLKMSHSWQEKRESQVVEYTWTKNRTQHSFKVEAELKQTKIEKKSETEFITEHYWGYTKLNQSQSLEYEVTHPTWNTYSVKQHNIDVNFGSVYGSDFEFLNGMKPKSVMLAEGSEITVENKN